MNRSPCVVDICSAVYFPLRPFPRANLHNTISLFGDVNLSFNHSRASDFETDANFAEFSTVIGPELTPECDTGLLY